MRNRPLRLLFLSPTYYPAVGGAERTVHDLCVSLANLGHQVDLVTPNAGGQTKEKVCDGFEVHRVGRVRRSRAAKFLLHQFYQYRKIRSMLQKQQYDIAVLVYGVHAALVQEFLRRHRIPVVILEFHLGTGAEISSGSDNPGYVFPILRWAYRRADRVIAISRDNRDFVAEVSSVNALVVPQGTDHTAIHPGLHSQELRRSFNETGPLLVTVSRLSPRKNLHDMLVAMRLIVDERPDAKLVIVGDGEQRNALEAQARELDLVDHVIFAGFLPDETVRRLRASADVFLSTSTYEGFGLSIVEALAAGLPVVAYDAGGTADYLEDGATGFVTPHAPVDFARAVLQILGDEQARVRMGERARYVVETQYNWERYVQQHVDVFEMVVADRCSP